GDGDIAKKHKENQSDEDEAENYDVADGGGGETNQVSAVIERDKVHAVRKQATVERFHFLCEFAKSGERLFAALEQDDAFYSVVVMIDADLPEARLESFVNIGHLTEGDGNTVAFGKNDTLHFRDGAEKADTADVDALAAHGEVASACVGIAGRYRCDNLRKWNIELQKLSRINIRDVLARGTTEGSNVDDAGNLLDLAADEPILRGLELVESIVRAGETIAVDFAYRRPGRKLRRKIGWKRDQLQAIQRFLPVPIIIAVVAEIEFDVAQTKDADRADCLKARYSEKNRLNRHGDLAFHFLRRPGGILRDDLHKRRRGVGIRFDIETEKNEKAADEPGGEGDDHKGAIAQEGGDEIAHRWSVPGCGAEEERAVGNDAVAGGQSLDDFERTIESPAQGDSA